MSQKETIKKGSKKGKAGGIAETHEAELQRLALRVSELINSDADGSGEVVDWFMQLTNDAGVSLENEDFCVPAFVQAVRRVQATKPVRRITTKNVTLHGAQQAYERLKEIVRRVDAGESLARIRDEREARMKESEERHRADELAAPEPKDKASDEWRYWKLRQIKAGFEAPRDSEPWAEAWREFDEFLNHFAGDPKRQDTTTAGAILPSLIIAWQKTATKKRRK